MGRVSRSPDVDSSVVGDRLVLYHRTTRTALVLNPTASWLWGLLRVPRTTGDLVSSLREQFPAVAEDHARTDVAALLDDLLRQGFVARET